MLKAAFQYFIQGKGFFYKPFFEASVLDYVADETKPVLQYLVSNRNAEEIIVQAEEEMLSPYGFVIFYVFMFLCY